MSQERIRNMASEPQSTAEAKPLDFGKIGRRLQEQRLEREAREAQRKQQEVDRGKSPLTGLGSIAQGKLDRIEAEQKAKQEAELKAEQEEAIRKQPPIAPEVVAVRLGRIQQRSLTPEEKLAKVTQGEDVNARLARLNERRELEENKVRKDGLVAPVAVVVVPPAAKLTQAEGQVVAQIVSANPSVEHKAPAPGPGAGIIAGKGDGHAEQEKRPPVDKAENGATAVVKAGEKEDQIPRPDEAGASDGKRTKPVEASAPPLEVLTVDEREVHAPAIEEIGVEPQTALGKIDAEVEAEITAMKTAREQKGKKFSKYDEYVTRYYLKKEKCLKELDYKEKNLGAGRIKVPGFFGKITVLDKAGNEIKGAKFDNFVESRIGMRNAWANSMDINKLELINFLRSEVEKSNVAGKEPVAVVSPKGGQEAERKTKKQADEMERFKSNLRTLGYTSKREERIFGLPTIVILDGEGKPILDKNGRELRFLADKKANRFLEKKLAEKEKAERKEATKQQETDPVRNFIRDVMGKDPKKYEISYTAISRKSLGEKAGEWVTFDDYGKFSEFLHGLTLEEFEKMKTYGYSDITGYNYALNIWVNKGFWSDVQSKPEFRAAMMESGLYDRIRFGEVEVGGTQGEETTQEPVVPIPTGAQVVIAPTLDETKVDATQVPESGGELTAEEAQEAFEKADSSYKDIRNAYDAALNLDGNESYVTARKNWSESLKARRSTFKESGLTEEAFNATEQGKRLNAEGDRLYWAWKDIEEALGENFNNTAQGKELFDSLYKEGGLWEIREEAGRVLEQAKAKATAPAAPAAAPETPPPAPSAINPVEPPSGEKQEPSLEEELQALLQGGDSYENRGKSSADTQLKENNPDITFVEESEDPNKA